MKPDKLLSLLQQEFSADQILTDASDLVEYAQDWSKLFTPNAVAIVRPRSAVEVQRLVKLANQHQFPLVPSGGRTGLSGGACATQGEVVVSLDRLNQIVEFDPVSQTVTCEAGVITEQLQQFATEQGLFYPVDFASSGSSQMGGNIATNAGGIKVIRWGMTRDWVMGLKVVTGSGELLELNNGLVKNATGYDFRHLFVGSEGTLGIIVEATIKLVKPPKELSVMVLGLEKLEQVYPVMELFQKRLPLTAFEFFSDAALKKVIQHHDLQRPFATKANFYVLIEVENLSADTLNDVLSCFEQVMEDGHILDGVISQSESQAQSLWQLRERISESISHETPYKNDISVTPNKVSEFLTEIDQIVADKYPDFEIIWFGHIGDGNLHLNILKPKGLDREEFILRCESVNPLIFAKIQQLKGSVSAEHGVGLLKKKYLHFSRSSTEIQYMRQTKRIFDPNNILNPGKVLD